MSHTDLCRGGHNVQEYLDEVESYLNIEAVGYPDSRQSRVILDEHWVNFTVFPGDKLTFLVCNYPGSPIVLFVNNVPLIAKSQDAVWGEVCTANFVSGKLLNPPDYRCTGVKLIIDQVDSTGLILKSVKKMNRYRGNFASSNNLVGSTSYKYSIFVPIGGYNTLHSPAHEFGFDPYWGADYNAGLGGVFKFLFEIDNHVELNSNPTGSTVVTRPASPAVPTGNNNFFDSYTRFDSQFYLIGTYYMVHCECTANEQIYINYHCRYELFDGTRDLRSPLKNSILKHFIDLHKDDPHNFIRRLNFTI